MTGTVRQLNRQGHGTIEFDTEVEDSMAEAVDAIYTARGANSAFFDADTRERFQIGNTASAVTIRKRLEEHPNTLILPPMAGGS